MFETIFSLNNRFDTESTANSRRDELLVALDDNGAPATLANLVGQVIAPMVLAPAALLSVIGWAAAEPEPLAG